MIVDIHTHVWDVPRQLGDAIGQLLSHDNCEPWERMDTGIAAHQRAMAPVQRAIIHGLVSNHGRAAVTHRHVADAVAHDPERLLGFAGIDPQASGLDESLDEAIALGLVGVTICPAGQAMHPCHSRAMHLYERCQQLKLPIFVHSGALFGNRAMIAFTRPDHFDEIARSFPDLRLIIAQLGRPWIEPTLNLLKTHQHVFADTSGLVNQPWQLYNALVQAHHYSVTDKILFGSGFPLGGPQEAIMNIYGINRFTQGTQLPMVPRQQLRRIVERDALSCLGIQVCGHGDPNNGQSNNNLIKEAAT